MTIDKNNPKNWLTEIRPAILKRANDCCELCNVPNNQLILRGEVQGIRVWQDVMNGKMYDENNGEYVGETYVADLDSRKWVRIVLTIAHLDHNIQNNDYSNLKALCQQCHNRHVKQNRAITRRKNKEKTLISLFEVQHERNTKDSTKRSS